jgi:hypothetical protein
MATAHAHIPATLEEALEKLRRDPSQPVRAHVDDLDVELRAVPHRRREGWQGESTDEIVGILRKGREAGGRAAPPEDM